MDENKTSQIIYTDPLAAVWQARKQGVRFQAENVNGNLFELSLKDLLSDVKRMISGYYLVHPKSLPLYEIRIGDLLDIDGDYEVVHSIDEMGFSIRGRDAEEWFGASSFPIMHRDGKAWINGEVRP